MAVKVPTVTNPTKGIITYKWVLANGDTGTPVTIPQHSRKSVQVLGTFGTGGSVQLEGSNEVAATYDNQSPTSPTWAILRDQAAGATIVLTSAGLKEVMDHTLQIRPNCTAGDGTTALTVEVTCIATRQ